MGHILYLKLRPKFILQPKGRIENNQFLTLQSLQRPNVSVRSSCCTVLIGINSFITFSSFLIMLRVCWIIFSKLEHHSDKWLFLWFADRNSRAAWKEEQGRSNSWRDIWSTYSRRACYRGIYAVEEEAGQLLQPDLFCSDDALSRRTLF